MTQKLDEQVVEDLACRRCVSLDEADAAEPGVVMVVVDVDDERRALEGRIGPRRRSLAQSRAMTTRSEASSGSSRRRSASAMKPYSPGSGTAPARYMTASFPSWSNARFAASSEPSASPSGFSWVVRRNRLCDGSRQRSPQCLLGLGLAD